MRVLHVSSLWPPMLVGGAERYASTLAGLQAEQGDDVGVLTLGVEGVGVVATVPPWPYALHDYATAPPWKRALFHTRDLFDPVTALRLRQVVRRFRPDVVHSHSVAGLSVAALLAPDVARVHHLHDYWLLCQRTSLHRDGVDCATRCAGCVPFSASRLAVLRRRPPRFVAVSESLAATHRAFAPWLDATVLRLPADGAGTPRPRPARAPGGPVVLGFIGQLTEQKGVLTLLDAVSALAGAAHLRVAGEGPLGAVVAQAAAGPRVEALGQVAGAGREAFFDSLDALVVPSTWREPGGLVLLEALVRGIPVLASRAGALPENIDPCMAPLLFDPGDVDGLVASVGRFAADPGSFAPTAAPPTWAEQVRTVAAIYAEERSRRTSSTA